MNEASFEESEVVRDSVERCIERVCEAVFRLGADAKGLMPGQPPAKIRGMGNRLRHAYDPIDVDVLWDATKLDLPVLQTAAAVALARLTSDQSRPNEPGAQGKECPT